jgi:predicted nuclease of predicted toxin-antitoxin system
MKGIIDAQLPRKFATLIIELGGDTIHTLDLPLELKTKTLILHL